MTPVPLGVAEIGLGYEYMRCAWVAEDDHFDFHKRKIAAAMRDEIKAAGLRWKLRKERGDVVPPVVEARGSDFGSRDSIRRWLEGLCVEIIWEGGEGDRSEAQGGDRSEGGEGLP